MYCVSRASKETSVMWIFKDLLAGLVFDGFVCFGKIKCTFFRVKERWTGG